VTHILCWYRRFPVRRDEIQQLCQGIYRTRLFLMYTLPPIFALHLTLLGVCVCVRARTQVRVCMNSTEQACSCWILCRCSSLCILLSSVYVCVCARECTGVGVRDFFSMCVCVCFSAVFTYSAVLLGGGNEKGKFSRLFSIPLCLCVCFCLSLHLFLALSHSLYFLLFTCVSICKWNLSLSLSLSLSFCLSLSLSRALCTLYSSYVDVSWVC